jgi:hypothetical protein
MYVPFSSSCVDIGNIQANQSAHGMVSSCDVLADLLESIEHFVGRLKVYTEISPKPDIDKIVVDIIVELLSILALVTRKLKQRRFREFFFTNVLPYSRLRRYIGKPCGQTHQRSKAEGGPTHARRDAE